MLASAPGKPPKISNRLSEKDERLYRLIPTDISFVTHLSFDDPGTEANLFGPDAEVICITNWIAPAIIIQDESTPQRRTKALTDKQQRTLFLRYNYAQFRLSALAKKQKKRFDVMRAQKMILWYQRALSTKSDLAGANLALVPAMAKRSKIEGVPFDELVSEGNMALLRSIEKFDVSKGFKFSTYACRAIISSLWRVAGQHWRRQERFPLEFNSQMEKPENGQTENETAYRVELIRIILETNRARLTPIQRRIIDKRFLTNFGKIKTLAEIGLSVGLSPERVRQISNLALKKIRALVERIMG